MLQLLKQERQELNLRKYHEEIYYMQCSRMHADPAERRAKSGIEETNINLGVTSIRVSADAIHQDDDMTAIIKAPDLGVVKSAAKAIRKSLNDTTKISHSKALELASNAFGFTTWHACRTHFKRVDLGFFLLSEGGAGCPSCKESVAAADELCRTLLLEEVRFNYNEFTLNACAAARSIHHFLEPLTLLGAYANRHLLKDKSRMCKSEGSILDIDRLTGSCQLCHRVRPIFGEPSSREIYYIGAIETHSFFLKGIQASKSFARDGVVDLREIKARVFFDMAGQAYFTALGALHDIPDRAQLALAERGGSVI